MYSSSTLIHEHIGSRIEKIRRVGARLWVGYPFLCQTFPFQKFVLQRTPKKKESRTQNAHVQLIASRDARGCRWEQRSNGDDHTPPGPRRKRKCRVLEHFGFQYLPKPRHASHRNRQRALCHVPNHTSLGAGGPTSTVPVSPVSKRASQSPRVRRECHLLVRPLEELSTSTVLNFTYTPRSGARLPKVVV